MDDYNPSTLVDTKAEYSKLICSVLRTPIYNRFRAMYDQGKLMSTQQGYPPAPLMCFQDLMEQIPVWNKEVIREHCEMVLKETECEFLDELVAAVFVAHTKIFTAVRITDKPQRKLELTIPQFLDFFHRAMIECKDQLWKNAYLFREDVAPTDVQRGLRTIEQLIDDGILGAVRSMLPVRNILREYLMEDVGSNKGAAAPASAAAATEEPEPVPTVAEALPVGEEEVQTEEVATSTDDIPMDADAEPVAIEEGAAATTAAEPVAIKEVPPVTGGATVGAEVDIPEDIATPVEQVTNDQAVPVATAAAAAAAAAEVKQVAIDSPDVIDLNKRAPGQPKLRFNDYDTVFDDKNADAQIVYAPKDAELHIPDEEVPDVEYGEADDDGDEEDGLKPLQVGDQELPMNWDDIPSIDDPEGGSNKDMPLDDLDMIAL
jgi:hypothetical protein